MAIDPKLNAMKFEIQEEALAGTRIKVVGVGGGGSNAVARMMGNGLTGVEFYVMNTDRQALESSPVPNKLAIGTKVTTGLGAGADPQVGREAALEDTERIIEILEGADMVFVAAGLGGGTGTGAAPVVASLAKEMNALTVAVVTRPFTFEGARRMKLAEKGLADLAGTVDNVIAVSNDRLLDLAPKGATILDAFHLADDVLLQAVQGISDVMTTPGMINRDFSDIKSIMSGMGRSMMGSASAKGEGAAVEAAKRAISCPLFEEGEIRGARGILINITGSSKLTLLDLNEACNLIRKAADHDEVQINFGLVLDEKAGDEVKVTVIATGFQASALSTPLSPPLSTMAHMERRTHAPVHRPAPKVEEAPLTMAAAASATSSSASLFVDPPARAEIEEREPVGVQAASEERSPGDDLETPAFLRRSRSIFS